MIGSFWNLCRACPSMPVDKLHSEYRSTYRWHEYTGPRQDVVRRAPQPAPGTTGGNPSKLQATKSMEEDVTEANTGLRFEPAIPRRKKHPELAYKTHEFLSMSEAGGSDDSLDSTVAFDRARSEERGGSHIRPSRRSKSEGPPTGPTGVLPGPDPVQSEYRLQYMNVASPPPRGRAVRSDSDPCECDDEEMMIASYPPPAPAPSAGTLNNAITRISTEYRLQFAWPRGGKGRNTRTEDAKAGAGNSSGPPRKSLSMGAIRPTGFVGANPVPVHKKSSADYDQGDEGASELEPLVGSELLDGPAEEFQQLQGEEKIQNDNLSKEEKPRRRKEFKTEYKKKFRPFSQYDYVEGKFQKKKELEAVTLPAAITEMTQSDSWYREVLELRKKAGEYKHRGWGTELVPQHIADLYNKQMILWEQVSRRSSLSALSLASTTPRSISKEEKEKENNKKSSPIKLISSRSTGRTSDRITDSERRKIEKTEEAKKDLPRSRKEYLIRHHLERTTGAGDGALLPSPTREKLEPVMPRTKEEDRPRSPQKASPKSSPRSARSQSVGPGLSAENRSPKRQAKVSTTSMASTHQYKGQQNGPAQAERRPRPTSLSTTGPSRPKSSSVPTTKPKPLPAKSMNGVQGAKIRADRTKVAERKDTSGSGKSIDEEEIDTAEEQPCTKDDPEPALVKSPPEPTRVKSPEQILMRSPEPVNWTVPLDTGKTFTVTQNVHEGELVNRPHSEVKAWTPPAVPPPAPQSAPPELAEQTIMLSSGWKSPPSEPVAETMASSNMDSFAALDGVEEKAEEEKAESIFSPGECKLSAPGTVSLCAEVSASLFDKSEAGTLETDDVIPETPSAQDSGLLLLEDPETSSTKHQYHPQISGSQQALGGGATASTYHVLESPPHSQTPISTQESPTKSMSLVSPSSGRSLASDVLEKARTRFDRFWGKGKDASDKEGKV